MKAAVLVIALVVFSSAIAMADGSVNPADSSFVVEITGENRKQHSGPRSSSSAAAQPEMPSSEESPQFRCDEVLDICYGLLPIPPDSAPPAPAQVTQAMVLRALRRVEVPAVRVRVQPPSGKTLVNLETIFSTGAAAFERTVTLLGRRVDLVVRPVSFRWSHGDGTSQRTMTAGVVYRRDRDPGDYITHQYLRVTEVEVGVEVDFAARFRVDGGPWREADGVVTVASAPQQLQVVEARPTLITP